MAATDVKIQVKRYILRVTEYGNCISLYDKDNGNYTADLIFTDKPMTGKSTAKQVPTLTFPLSQYQAALDMLRNEKPVFFVNGMGIETMCDPKKLEKVGEAER